MIINILTLAVALIVSACAGYFSVWGIALIFSGAFWSSVIMGSVLEIAKVVTASWLFRHWNKCNKILRAYLVAAMGILMLITSLGIFGYLARAHIEQTANMAVGAQSQIEIVDERIKQKKSSLGDVEKRVSIIDDATRKLIDTNKAQTAIRITDAQIKNRLNLLKERDDITKELNDLVIEKVRLENEIKKSEVEVGPIKYVADFFFNNNDTNTLEKAVRWMILIIVFVFDPLAISLVIAANSGLYWYQRKSPGRPRKDERFKYSILTNETNNNTIQVKKTDVKKM